MIYILVIGVVWLVLAWQTVKDFPNDGPQLRGWVWFIPLIPLVYYLLTLTGLVMLVVGISIDGLMYKLKNKWI